MQDCDGLTHTLGLMGLVLFASVAVPALKLNKTGHERCLEKHRIPEAGCGVYLLELILLSLTHRLPVVCLRGLVPTN